MAAGVDVYVALRGNSLAAISDATWYDIPTVARSLFRLDASDGTNVIKHVAKIALFRMVRVGAHALILAMLIVDALLCCLCRRGCRGCGAICWPLS